METVRKEVLPIAAGAAFFGTMPGGKWDALQLGIGTMGLFAGSMFATLGGGPVVRSAMWTSGVMSFYVASSMRMPP